MLILARPIHSSLRCFVDPKGDVNTNGFIAEQLAQRAITEECIGFVCRDIAGELRSCNVWSCPNALVDQLLAIRRTMKLDFDLYVRESDSQDPPHFALSLEDGQSPEEAFRAVLDSMAIQVPCAFDLRELALAPSDFVFLLPSKRTQPTPSAPLTSMRHSQPGVPPRHRRDRRW